MQHRGVPVLGGPEVHSLREDDLALEEAPVDPHVHLLLDVTIRVDHVDVGRSSEPLPVLGCPRSRADDDLLAGDGTLVGRDGGHGTGCVPLVAGDRGPVDALHSPLAALLVEAPHCDMGSRISRPEFVEHHVAVLGLEVRPQLREERVRVRPCVEVRRVSACYLGCVELDVVLFLVRFTDRYVADLLEAEVHRIGLPHFHAGPEDGMERMCHVQVADASAGQTCGARPRTLLVDQDDVASPALA